MIEHRLTRCILFGGTTVFVDSSYGQRTIHLVSMNRSGSQTSYRGLSMLSHEGEIMISVTHGHTYGVNRTYGGLALIMQAFLRHAKPIL